MTQLEAPEHAGSREQAQRVVEGLPSDLSGLVVVLDCSRLAISTPSFLDEVVKEVLVERRADALNLIDATERTREQIERSAQNRQVAGRVHVALRVA